MTSPPEPIENRLAEYRSRYPRAVHAVERLLACGPMLRAAVGDMVRAYGEQFFRRANERAGEIDFLCEQDPERFDGAVQAYIHFCLEFVRKQAMFLKTGKYSFKDFDEILADLYENDEAVERFYLPSLLFSFIFSPNYYEFFDFFETEFLPRTASDGVVAEIGCGHGVYLGRTMLHRPRMRGLGIDIAPGALNTARRMFGYYELPESRFELCREDIRGRLDRADGCADAVICCEVLEHLPDPAHAVAELRRITAPGGVLMLSAAIRMESVDHLHVFGSHREVVTLANEVGFRVEAERVVPLVKGNITDRAERARLAEDPKVPVGYICCARPV